MPSLMPGTMVLWRKAMPAGAAATCLGCLAVGRRATTNDSAAAPSTPQGHIPTIISNGHDAGRFLRRGRKNQMRVPASGGCDRHCLGSVQPSKCRLWRRVARSLAGKTAPALRNDETALLMALHKTMNGIDRPLGLACQRIALLR